jgi:DNA repair protein RadA/Sms
VAKEKNIPLILVGHVTKEGSIAGPKVLEHMVDVVLYLEGDKFHSFRLLRAHKNRYGSDQEVGVFAMGERGLSEIKNPSDAFLAERLTGASGSVVTATMEGTRPVLVEIQALTTPTSLAYPRRTASGFDLNRLNLLVAVLQKHLHLPLQNKDIYVNVASGFRVSEPAVDLAVALAIVSGVRDEPIDSRTCVFGEVGLSGEVRKVGQSERRIKEAKKLGFSKIVSPERVRSVQEAVRMSNGKCRNSKPHVKC